MKHVEIVVLCGVVLYCSLMNELTGWVLGHKAGMKAEQLQQQQQQTQQQKRHLYRRKKYVAPRKLKAALKAGVHNNLQYRYPDG